MTVKKSTSKQKILVAGTLFGMFFGAGNLIFPVHLGQMAGSNVIPAIIGFIVTAVGIPIFGVAAIGVTHSDGLQELSSKVGKGYGIFFTCLLYPVSYTHLRAHETGRNLVCRLLLEKKKTECPLF